MNGIDKLMKLIIMRSLSQTGTKIEDFAPFNVSLCVLILLLNK